jgi:hypothetical protein
MNETPKLQAIKTTDGFFVKDARGFSFNGERPRETWKRDWFKVSSIEKIEKVVPETKTLTGYSLKPDYAPTAGMPARVDQKFFGEEYYENILYPLYTAEYEVTPETTEPTEVEVEVVAEVDGELIEASIHFPVYGAYPKTDGKCWAITSDRVKLGLLDEIITPEILRQERPCELSSQDSYAIIRAHIKDNIDPKVAEITSDYDFCLTVTKRIPLAKKEEYKVDENFSLFGGRRKRKPKIVTKYREARRIEIYKIAPRLNGRVYDGYPEAPMFRGENARNLKDNIDTYLEELMEEINRPARDCPNCNGEGVLFGNTSSK